MFFGIGDGHKFLFENGAWLERTTERWLTGICDECIEQVKEEERYSEFWAPINITGSFQNIDWPSVHWAGWYDLFGDLQIDAFNGYRAESQLEVRNSHWLVVEPHGHCYDVVFPAGIRGPLLAVELARIVYDAASKEKEIIVPEGIKHITFFVMGPLGEFNSVGNYWTTMDFWPEYQEQVMYLSSDGSLNDEVRANSTFVEIVSDPADPVPTVGGPNLFGTCGAENQVEIEERADVITFTTPVLEDNVVITGRPIAKLFVASTANDTDFHVRLSDVTPEGESVFICEGVVRMRWRKSSSEYEFITPGETYELDITMWFTSFVFNAGHRIRISLLSSNSDRYSVNPQNGLFLAEEDEETYDRAINRIFMDPEHQSSITFPVVTLDQLPEVKWW